MKKSLSLQIKFKKQKNTFMKKTFFLLLLVATTNFVSAQQDKFKFGTCPEELLQMKRYDKDADAAALVIYEKSDSYYSLNGATGDFEIKTEYVIRIKIFTQEGAENYGSAEITFVEGSDKMGSENIDGLVGYTYNLENGKIVRTKLSKEYIFTEDVNDYIKRLKFALPQVKVGSVIEYKYSKNSPFYYDPDHFTFQRDIPVKYSCYRLKVPEYFTMNRAKKGYHQEYIKQRKEKTNDSFIIGGDVLRCTAEEFTYEVKDLPSLKDEDFIWNFDDYRAGIMFEIRSLQVPGKIYRTYSKTWANVAGALADYEYFGKQFDEKNILKKEIPEVLKNQATDIDSIRAILNLVRSKVKFNDRRTLIVRNQNKALKEGLGTSGEVNAILLNALKNAGFRAYPVAMSLRSEGRLRWDFPSQKMLNYFVVLVRSKGKEYYLDATKEYTDINVLPLDCLVEKALIIYDRTFNLSDLTEIGTNSNKTHLVLNFNENGILTGKKMEIYSGNMAYSFKQNYEKSENEKKHTELLEIRNEVEISNYKTDKRTAQNLSFTESYDFIKKSITLNEDVLSFNPLLFTAMTTNAMKAETRKLPVEFTFPYEHQINVNLTIPQGWVLDEMPQSEKIIFENGEIEMVYIAKQSLNGVQIQCTFKQNIVFIPADYYKSLRDFWYKMFNKQNEMITIKRSKE